MAVSIDVGAVVGDEFIDDGHRSILGNAAGSEPSDGRYARPRRCLWTPWHEIREELRQPAKDLHELIPDVMKSLRRAVEGVAQKQANSRDLTKELLALVISATRECDGCIVAHARGALREGATRQQIAEAMGVLIALNGGPGTVWGPRALRAYDEAVAARKS